MKDKAVKRSGKKIALIALVSLLAILILAASLFFGISSCTNKDGKIDQPAEGITVRKAVPDDGTKPTDHSAIDNIAYMAYVLDNQPSYHVYASNSSKATGYEQITQTWKDYKSAELSGVNQSVMVCSDISYSMFVKASTQSCFVGGTEAYMRTGSRPAKDSVPSTVDWNSARPSYYTRDDYRAVYGDFSTELTVYVINEDTLESADGVIDNKDGTYTQKFYLSPEAAYWYQYGMKTRGSLKFFPEFKKIEITFTFDDKWQVLSSYCEETARIAPSALGGMPMDSSAKTTTQYDYSADKFDSANYAYFDNYYKNYLGAVKPDDPTPGTEARSLIEVLGSAFSEVIDPNGNGMQFALDLTIGETDYTGKVYAKLGDMGDVLGSLDVRLALEKKGSGKQDLFVQFKDGALKVYYSDAFAMVADIGKISDSVAKFTEWVNSFNGEANLETFVEALSDEQSTGLDFNSLLNDLGNGFTWDETSACVSIVTDNLLGLGVGVDLRMNFDSSKDEYGWTDTLRNISLGGVTYNSTPVKLSLGLVPDEGSAIISRDENGAYADLAEYMDGVYNLLNSKTYLVNISLDGSCDIDYIKGLTADAAAQVKLSGGYKNIEVNVPVTVSYNNLSVVLEAYYTINLDNGNYGDVYLSVKEICGKSADAKVCCNIKDTVDAVTKIINFFNGTADSAAVATLSEEQEDVNVIANVINTVLCLDYASVIKELKANNENLNVAIDVDEVLSALEIDLGIKFGELSLTLGLKDGKANLEGELPALGLGVKVEGSERDLTVPATNKYADITNYVNGVYNLLNSKTYLVDLSLDGSGKIEYVKGVEAYATAQVKLGSDFKSVEVNLPLTVKYNGFELVLEVYYTINLEDGGYGNVYLHLTNVGGKAVDAKVGCNIEDTIEAVTKLIEYFNGAEAAAYSEGAEKTANVVDVLLSLDYGAIIGEIIANENEVKLSVSADEILEQLGLDLGVKFGEVALELGIDENKRATLAGNVSELGLNLGLRGSDKEITVPDTTKYADVRAYVDGVYNLLNSKTYFVDIKLDGLCEIEYVSGAEVYATAQVKVSEDFKDVAVNVPVTINYRGFVAELEVYYTVNLESGNYGNVYLHLTNVGGKGVDAKVGCNIEETVEAVKSLIGYFGTETLSDGGEAQKIADIVNFVLGLDYTSIIIQLKADENNIEVSVDVDEVLGECDIDLGVEFGELSLELYLDENGKTALGGELSKLGLFVALSGSEEDIKVPETNKYANVTAYVKGVENLLNSKTYLVNLTIDGSGELEYISDVNLNAGVELSLGEDYKEITVKIPDLYVSYKTLSVTLDVYYNINLEDENYGTVYLNLKNVCGATADAKIYCNIKDTVDAVTKLINYFGANEEEGGNTTYAFYGEESKEVAEIISFVVNLDYAGIITQLKADENGANLTLDIDAILGELEIELGIKLGKLSLDLGLDGAEKVTLEANLPAFGFNLAISGSEQEITFDTENYLDLTAYVNAVDKLIEGTTYLVKLSLDGSCKIDYVSGVTLDAVAQVNFNESYDEITVHIPDLAVTYNAYSINAEVYYTIKLNSDGEDVSYGTVYLNIGKINGQTVGAKAYCDIADTVDAVTMLLAAIGIEGDGSGSSGSVEVPKIANVLDFVLGLNFNKIIEEIKADESGANVSVSIDELLGAFDINAGVELGSVELKLGIDKNGIIAFNGKISELGLELGVGAGYAIKFDNNGYLNVTELIELITAATEAAQEIINKEDIVFNIDNATLTVDGVAMNVTGSGEVIWKKNVQNSLRVAADLTFTIKENASQSVAVKFLYDETSDPLVRFSVNGLGLEIYREDIEGVGEGFAEIMQVVNSLISAVNGTGSASVNSLSNADEGVQPMNLNADSFADILSGVLKVVNNVTIGLQEVEGADVKDLLITYAVNGRLTLSSNGNLAVKELFICNNDGTEIFNAENVWVSVGNSQKLKEVNSAISEADFYTDEMFLKAVYQYVLDLYDNLSVKNLLGDNTYSVEVTFNGTASGIEALNGITVNANLYYTEVTGEEEKTSKLIEAELDMNISGTAVKANAYFAGHDLYIELNQIGETPLYSNAEKTCGIAIKANTNDIYAAVDSLVNIITSDAVAKLVAVLGEPAPAALNLDGENSETSDRLKDVLNYLLTLKIEEVIQFNSIATDDTRHNTLTVNPDALLEAFGSDIRIGLVHIEVNPVTHSVYATVANENAAWITFNAQAVTNGENGEHKLFVPDNRFIDIAFVATLLEDLNVTLDGMTSETENEETGETEKNTDVRLTLTGELTINITVVGDVKFESVKLTVGFDEKNEFYVSLYGHLLEKKVLVTVASESWVSLTYSGGFITLGRDVNSANPKYRVVTIAYLIDNLLNSNSPIFWWLGTSDISGLLNLIPSIKNLELSSGLTATEDFYLYDNGTETPVEPTDNSFNLSQYITGMLVKIGEYTSSYGNGVNNFGLSDNYYAFGIDVKSLIGETIKDISAAIVREKNGGIKGIDVYANVADALNITANLDGGLSDNHAVNYFSGLAEGINFDIYKNYTDRIFGCYDSQNDKYYYSEINPPYNLTVYGFDGDDYDNYESSVPGDKEILSRTINSGSTVHLAESETVLADGRKLIYVDQYGNDLGLSFVITSHTVVYAMIVGEEVVTFHNDDGTTYTLNLRAGDKLPDPDPVETDGKIFAGWYVEEQLITSVTSMQVGVYDYYAKYIEKNVTINGIIYTFAKDSTYKEGGYYYISGTSDVSAYTAAGSVLVLDVKEISGYSVTAIGENAFAGTSIKNVVVSENIIEVGAKAFANNTALESVTFLADIVHLNGKFNNNNTNTVFINCAESLKVYFNEITAEDSDNWSCYKVTSEWHLTGTTYTSHNLEANNLFGANTWAYVNFEIDFESCDNLIDVNDEDFHELINGINTVKMTKKDIQAYIISVLNGLTQPYGYINAFTVYVENALDLNGKMYTVNIKITEDNQTEWWYSISADGVYGEEQKAVTILGEIITLNETYFIKAGTTVELLPYNGLMFIDCDYEEAVLSQENYVFTMPVSTLEINVVYQKKPISEVKLTSFIESTYGEVSTNGYVVTLETDGETVLETPVANGYVFVGWAYDVLGDGNLLFAESVITAQNAVPEYYAIWAVERGDVSFDVNNDRTMISAKTLNGGSFYAWYADEDENFSGAQITSLNTEHTALRARLQYTLTVEIKGNSNSHIWIDGNKATNNGTTAKCEKSVLEGETLEIKDADSTPNGKIYQIWSDADTSNALVGNIQVKERKTFGIEGSSKSLTLKYGDEELTNQTTITVKGDININVTF